MSGALDHAAVCGISALRELVFALEGTVGIHSMGCHPGLVSISVDWPRWNRLVELGAIVPKYTSPSSISAYTAIHSAQWGVRSAGDVEVRIISLEPAPVEDSTWPPF